MMSGQNVNFLIINAARCMTIWEVVVFREEMTF